MYSQTKLCFCAFYTYNFMVESSLRAKGIRKQQFDVARHIPFITSKTSKRGVGRTILVCMLTVKYVMAIGDLVFALKTRGAWGNELELPLVLLSALSCLS